MVHERCVSEVSAVCAKALYIPHADYYLAYDAAMEDEGLVRTMILA